MFAFLIRKQENGSQNVSTLWMCFLHCRQSRWAQQSSAVNKASFPCWNELSRNQMHCVAGKVRWCWFSFMRAKLFVINFHWLSEFQSNDCSQHTIMMFLYISIITILREAPCEALCNSLAMSHLRQCFSFVVPAVFEKGWSCCDFAVHCRSKKN